MHLKAWYYLPVTAIILLCSIFACEARRWQPSAASCSPCTCSYTRVPQVGNARCKLANCANLHLTSLPMGLPSDVECLDVKTNDIQQLDKHILDRYRSLKGLRLSDNNVTQLQDDVFYNLTRLQYLDLDGNKFVSLPEALFNGTRLYTIKGLDIRQIPGEIFLGLKSLRNLEMTLHQLNIPSDLFKDLDLQFVSLHFTQARVIPESLFSSCSKALNELHLKLDVLREIPENLLKPLAVLQTIKISTQNMSTVAPSIFNEQLINNKIFKYDPNDRYTDFRRLKVITIEGVRSLPPTVFHSLPYLEHLSIQRHESDLDEGMFNDLMSLASLDLSNNCLTQMKAQWFNELFRLRKLNMSRNSLQILQPHELDALRSIDVLDLSFNAIPSLDESYFRSFSMEINHLNLSNNQLQELPQKAFEDMNDLKTLKLNNNSIQNLPLHIFDSLQTLKTLNLENNQLTSLDYFHFNELTDLQLLDLSNNSISQLGDRTFYELNAIKDIYLSGNNISHFPVQAFSIVTLLENVKLTGNPINCDCGIEPLIYLRNYVFTQLEGVCTKPDDLAGISISQVSLVQACPESDLIVSPTTLFVESSATTQKLGTDLTGAMQEDTTISDTHQHPFFSESTQELQGLDGYSIPQHTTPVVVVPPTWRDWFAHTKSEQDPKHPDIRPVEERKTSVTETHWFQAAVIGGSVCTAAGFAVLLRRLNLIPFRRLGQSYTVNRR